MAACNAFRPNQFKILTHLDLWLFDQGTAVCEVARTGSFWTDNSLLGMVSEEPEQLPFVIRR